MNVQIEGNAQIKDICFKKHFIRIGKIRQVSGLTMLINLQINIKVGNFELDSFVINSHTELTADEFNKIRLLKCNQLEKDAATGNGAGNKETP